jgi:hypothetical protein
MNTNHLTNRKAIARMALAGIATGAAALTLAGPASADHALLDMPIFVPGCGSSGQICGFTPTFTVFAPNDQVRVQFVAGPGCSVTAFNVIDGQPQPLAQLSSTPGAGSVYTVNRGFHTIGVQAKGAPAGCKSGQVASYSGVLRVDSVGS